MSRPARPRATVLIYRDEHDGLWVREWPQVAEFPDEMLEAADPEVVQRSDDALTIVVSNGRATYHLTRHPEHRLWVGTLGEHALWRPEG